MDRQFLVNNSGFPFARERILCFTPYVPVKRDESILCITGHPPKGHV